MALRGRGLPDADAILARMRADTGHPWVTRLAAAVRIGRPLQPGTAMRDRAGTPLLTYSELRALSVLSYGLTVPMAAELLGLSEETVSRQLASARRRLGAKNSTHAVALAIRRGVLQ